MDLLGYLTSAPTGTISGMIFMILLVAIWLVVYSIALHRSKNLPKLNPKSATHPFAYLGAKNVFIVPSVFKQDDWKIEAIKI